MHVKTIEYSGKTATLKIDENPSGPRSGDKYRNAYVSGINCKYEAHHKIQESQDLQDRISHIENSFKSWVNAEDNPSDDFIDLGFQKQS